MPQIPDYHRLESENQELRQQLESLKPKTMQPLFEPFGRETSAASAGLLSDMYITEALSACKVGLWCWDIEEDDMIVSESYFLMLGFKLGNHKKTRALWPEGILPVDRDKVRDQLDAFMVSPTAKLEMEFRVYDATENVRWTLCRGYVMKWHPDKSPARLAGTIIDITEKKRIEDELKESEQRLETLLGNLPGIAFRCRKAGKWYIDFVSIGCQEFIGCQPEFLTENYENYKALIHPEDRALVWERIEAALEKKQSYEMVYRMNTAHGEVKWVWERGCGVFAADGTFLSLEGLITDVTIYKNIEENLQRENIRLKSMVQTRHNFGDIVGKSEPMQRVYDMILQAAASDANVIVYGESGTGKELVAQAVHKMSDRSDKAFISVNCGAIPDNLLESEFFGYKKGAFTGANMDKPGYLDLAHGGTLFLDEVGEINLNMQVKLLRAIEGGGFTPIGGRKIKHPDLRIIAATNRNLEDSVRLGLMRQDFFYRIHIVPIRLPALRKRGSDIPLLIYHFLQMYSDDSGIATIPEDVLQAMQTYDWPGNVRELQNMVQRYVTLKRVDFIGLKSTRAEDMGGGASARRRTGEAPDSLKSAMQQYERELILEALEHHGGNRTQTAKSLKIGLRTLQRKLADYGIKS